MLCHVSVHSGAFCLRHRARDPISVAFFDRVALFSDFNHLFELLDLLYIGIMETYQFPYKAGSARVFGYTVYRGFLNQVYGILHLKNGYWVYHFL